MSIPQGALVKAMPHCIYYRGAAKIEGTLSVYMDRIVFEPDASQPSSGGLGRLGRSAHTPSAGFSTALGDTRRMRRHSMKNANHCIEIADRGGESHIFNLLPYAATIDALLVLMETLSFRGMGVADDTSEPCGTLVLPEGQTHIDNFEYDSCAGITALCLPDSLTHIGENAFGDCTGLTAIVLPENLSAIGYRAFDSCTALSSVAVSEKLAQLGIGAFSYCIALKTIRLPNSLTQITNSAFYGCTGLSSVTLPKNLTHIGDMAFLGCFELSDITLPEGLEHIGEGAFFGCTRLRSVRIPKSVTHIGKQAFSDDCIIIRT